MPSVVFKPIAPAVIEWQGDVPFSAAFGDVYFSREGGMTETEHVFLGGNNLPERWKNQPHFTILETGFGTGLNFLCTLQSWRRVRQKGQQLCYISVEKHPIPMPDLERLHAQLPQELQPFAATLRQALPPAIAGFHWSVFEEEQATFLLIQADLETALSELEAKIDAWFLDGFSPAKNPDMWGDALYAGMKNLSAEGATFATYTAAIAVRAGVENAGFAWQRPRGFGHKKNMLSGQLSSVKNAVSAPQNAIVIGGGLAGCFAANALARSGVDVTLIERHAQVAQEASGNEAAIMKPYLAKEWAAQTLLYNQAFYYARQWALKSGLFQEIGALQLEEESRHFELGLPSNVAEMVGVLEASALAGVKLRMGGVFQPHGGWVKPKLLCETALQHPKITRVFSTEAVTLKRVGAAWQVNQKWEAANVIVANAKDALAFPQLSHLPLTTMRGQVTIFQQSTPLKTIVGGDGYAIPHGNFLTLGATYDRHDMEAEAREVDNQKNISAYNDVFANPLTEKPLGERVAWRTTTPSKRPIVGKMEEGLYASLGLGSRGTLLAPYLAEQIAAEIMGTPQPLQKSVKTVLSKY